MTYYFCTTNRIEEIDHNQHDGGLHWIRIDKDPIGELGTDIIIKTFGVTTRVNLNTNQAREFAMELLESIQRERVA